MNGDPLDIFKDLDNDLYCNVKTSGQMAFEPGTLDPKTKVLMALAIDASHGAENGVKALAGRAIQMGATKQEIMEALRVAYHISGAAAVYSSAAALRDLFE